jgi:hypothetical protein
MTNDERALYHQIHPAKLATDIAASSASAVLLWQHDLAAGLAVMFIPSILVSFALMRWIDLTPYRDSAFGRYLSIYMTRAIQAIRLGGAVLIALAAWWQLGWLIAGGALIVILAWLNGKIFPRRESAH